VQISFSDAAQITDIEYCIIGTGPAGLTCALTLAAAGRKVFVAEAGGEDISANSQDLYQGEVIGDPYFSLDTCRLRYFGGTSNHWNGWCRRLDEVDFRGKGHKKIGKWPISKPDLDPYFANAASILEISPFAEDMELDDTGLKQIAFSLSPPVRFSQKYSEKVRRVQNLALCLNCSFLHFELDGGVVQHAVFSNPSGAFAKVKAKVFVLSAGGIENCRLLAWTNILTGGELVKESKTHLGAYWTEHPHFSLGDAIVQRDWRFRSGLAGTQFFAPTEEFMDNNGTLNCGLRLTVNPDPEQGKKLVQDLVLAAPRIAKWVCSNYDSGTLCAATLRGAWEQEPTAGNRVSLSSDKDRFGIPKAILYWRKNDRDLATAKKTAETLGAYLAKNNFGRLRLRDWLLQEGPWPEDDELGGNHHMGGTRMGERPSEAVVDSNLRLFHCSNAYVLGSSVFPSGGHANPTLTIVELALRLAQHLRRL
jgi:choline dehydrogenase-like flavoprotein